MKELTTIQEIVWTIILQHYEDYRIEPSRLEIAEKLEERSGKGFSKQAVSEHIAALIRKGYLKKIDHTVSRGQRGYALKRRA